VARPQRAMTRAIAPLAAAALTAAPLALAAPAAAVPADSSTVFVNEIHYDNAGTDTGEFVEIAGPSGTDLTGWSVVFYNGNGGAVYGSRALTGTIPGAAGSYGATSVPFAGIQNGNPDGIALVQPDGAVRQFLSYGGTFAGVGGAANGLTSTDIGVAETTSTPVGQSLQLTGTGTAYGQFDWAAPATATPGAANNGQTFGTGDPDPDPDPEPAEQCGDEATLIHDIQGTGAAFDPAFGGTRSVEGVVTAAMLGGYFVQEEPSDADTDPQTSEALFVFQSGAAPTVGNVVRVTGNVAEFDGKTQMSGVATRLECGASTDTITPVALTLPLASTNLEHLEGMRVSLPETLVISEYFNYDRFGEVVLAKPRAGEDRLMTPTAVVDPGPAAQTLLAENELRQVIVDDRSRSQNPSVLPHPGNGEPFSLTNRFRGGDTVTGLEGVVDDAFDAYRVQPTRYGTYASVNPRPEARPEVGGDVQVASFNVLNYFLTLDAGDNQCGPNLDQDCRGANDEGELARQRAKIVSAIAGLDADVVGLMEMENTPGVEPAADLVDGLDEAVGEGTYDFIDTGVVGGDAIRLGFLYKPGAVTPVGEFDVLDSRDDPRFDDTRNRPMLTQTFDTVPAAGAPVERFTVSVNHLKSKGSACTGDPDAGDGQGNCNLTRTAAAEAIADHLASDPTGSGDPDHLLIGDMNSYDHEDPIRAFVTAGYQDLVKRFGGEHAYGYVFDGMVGYLDHALASPSLDGQVTGASEWHINADEPDVLDYDTSFKPGAVDALYAPDRFRSSDHDPVLVGLDLVSTGLAAEVDPVKPKVGKPATVIVDVTRSDGVSPTDGTLTVTRDGEVVGTAAVTGSQVRVPVEPFPRKGFYELDVSYTDGSSQDARTTLVVSAVGRP
jgi:predicted extracellular nuclease